MSKIGDITTDNLRGNPPHIQPIYQGDQIFAYAVPEEEIKAITGDNVEYLGLKEIRDKQTFVGIRKPNSATKPEQRVGLISADLFEEHFGNTGQFRSDIELSAVREAKLTVQNCLKTLNYTLQTICRDNQAPGDYTVQVGDDLYRITYGLHDDEANPNGLTAREYENLSRREPLPLDINFQEDDDLSFQARTVLRNAFDTVSSGDKAYIRMNTGAVFQIKKIPNVNRLDL